MATKTIIDHNRRGYPSIEMDTDPEEHDTPGLQATKLWSSITNRDMTVWSGNGLKNFLNDYRSLANGGESMLTKDVPVKVLSDVADAARKTGFNPVMLFALCDWEKSMDERSDAGDAHGIAQKVSSMANELISSLGRHPTNGEVFMAHVFGSAGQVMEKMQMAKDKPDEEATPGGGGKNTDNIFKKKIIKTSGDKTPTTPPGKENKKIGPKEGPNKVGDKNDQKRTNLEVYRFFTKRAPKGYSIFKGLPFKTDKYSV